MHPTSKRFRPEQAFVALAVSLGACSDTAARERLAHNAQATWDSAVDVAVEAAGQVQAGLEEQYRQLQPRIDALREHARTSTGAARVRAEQLLAELEDEREVLRIRIEQLKGEGAQAWKRMVREAQDELANLSHKLDAALEETD
jgi:hypothetical protein